jgi:hypothetical protein
LPFDEAEIAGFTTWDQSDDILWREIPLGESIQSIEDSPDPSEVEGVWVHAWDSNDPSNEIWFWERTYTPLDSWEMWDDLIDLGMDRYNNAPT